VTEAIPRRVRLDLTYDGTEFAGWQLQPGQRTVQGEVERILSRLAGDRAVRVHGSGRTDSGAHARIQVAHADVLSALDDDRLLYSLRRLLPRDVRPLNLRTVAGDFDARYHAISKSYRYRLDLSRHGDPFRSRYALHVPQALDAARIDAALVGLTGRHDWSSFTGSACKIEDRVRTMLQARYMESGDEGQFLFRANGFLTHMVRNLVGTLLEVGRGQRGADELGAILASRRRTRAGAMAAARGLCLWEIEYPLAPTGSNS